VVFRDEMTSNATPHGKTTPCLPIPICTNLQLQITVWGHSCNPGSPKGDDLSATGEAAHA
jgi:hypothetical protein